MTFDYKSIGTFLLDLFMLERTLLVIGLFLKGNASGAFGYSIVISFFISTSRLGMVSAPIIETGFTTLTSHLITLYYMLISRVV